MCLKRCQFWLGLIEKPNDTHRRQNPRKHIPLRNTTAEELCYGISHQEPRQANGFERLKDTVDKKGGRTYGPVKRAGRRRSLLPMDSPVISTPFVETFTWSSKRNQQKKKKK